MVDYREYPVDVKPGCDLRALRAVGDAGGLEVGDVEDQVGRGHRGGESEEGTSGELHLDCCFGVGEVEERGLVVE